MRTVTTHTTVYRFDELSDKAKQKAIEKRYDINVDFDWWDYMYADAETIGCTIDGFDIDRGGECSLTCEDAPETARLIVENHGETCGTRKLADQYLKDRMELLGEEEEGDFDALDTIFQRALGEEYLSLLRQEYEYQTSEAAIIETILANEYEFTEDGRIF